MPFTPEFIGDMRRRLERFKADRRLSMLALAQKICEWEGIIEWFPHAHEEPDEDEAKFFKLTGRVDRGWPVTARVLETWLRGDTSRGERRFTLPSDQRLNAIAAFLQAEGYIHPSELSKDSDRQSYTLITQRMISGSRSPRLSTPYCKGRAVKPRLGSISSVTIEITERRGDPICQVDVILRYLTHSRTLMRREAIDELERGRGSIVSHLTGPGFVREKDQVVSMLRPASLGMDEQAELNIFDIHSKRGQIEYVNGSITSTHFDDIWEGFTRTSRKFDIIENHLYLTDDEGPPQGRHVAAYDPGLGHRKVRLSDEEIENRRRVEEEINRRYELGQSLIKLVFTGRASAVIQGLKAGAQINYQDENGRTALHIACLYHAEEVIEELMRHPELDPTIADKQGKRAADLISLLDEYGDVYRSLIELEYSDRWRSVKYQPPIREP